MDENIKMCLWMARWVGGWVGRWVGRLVLGAGVQCNGPHMLNLFVYHIKSKYIWSVPPSGLIETDWVDGAAAGSVQWVVWECRRGFEPE